MNHHENLKVMAFVGLSGSGKSTAIEHFTAKGIPKVDFTTASGKNGTQHIISQIHDLSAAGQHRIVMGGLYGWDEFKLLRHEFPGELKFVAIVAPKHKRYQWLESRAEHPQAAEITQARDTSELEDIQKGDPIAAADYFVLNNGGLNEFTKQLDAIAEEINF